MESPNKSYKSDIRADAGRRIPQPSMKSRAPRRPDGQHSHRSKDSSGGSDLSPGSSRYASPTGNKRGRPLHLPDIRQTNSVASGSPTGSYSPTRQRYISPSRRDQKKKPSQRAIGSHAASKPGTNRPAKQKLLDYVRENVIGGRAIFHGPFGEKNIIYCDYTASGKPLEFIESYIGNNVYPFYANTHTTSSISAQQTTRFRKDARSIIKQCVNALEKDAVVFTGAGTTAAIHKLIHVMDVKKSAKNTVVIYGPFEHHSNILPWKEMGLRVERVGVAKDGTVDMTDLRQKLQKHKAKKIIGTFSACSNVSGILVNTDAISELIHQFNGIVIWDYATGAPYIKIDMNAPGKKYKDAVVCSPHKFVGGVGTPGLLIAKKHLFVNSIPGGVGGGTVLYVTRDSHWYLDDVEEKEEGGTPAIVESIRAGMIFQLKQAIGVEFIEDREEYLCQKALKAWTSNKNIHILGGTAAKRLPIFSFLVRHAESGKLLHHNFISTLLNDLYGVQVRGGCACAGPYAQDLLGMPENIAQQYATFLLPPSTDDQEGEIRNLGIIKPGFSRLNLAYFLDDERVDYILHAVNMVATHGWKLLPMYSYDPESGDWFHINFTPAVRSLEGISYETGALKFTGTCSLSTNGEFSLQEMKEESDKILFDAENECQDIHLEEDIKFSLNEHMGLLWFMLPQQAMFYMTNPSDAGFIGVYRPVPNGTTSSRSRLQLNKDEINTLRKQLTQLSISHGRK